MKMSSDDYFTFIKDTFQAIYDKLNVSGRCAINILYEDNMKSSNGGRVFIVAEYWKILSEIGYKFAGIVDLTEKSAQRPKLTAWGSWLSPSAPYIYNPKECVIIVYKDVWKKEKQGTSYFNKSNKKEFQEYVFGMWKYQAETRGLTKANFSLDIPSKTLKILGFEEDLVLDPFMGSGTTALACEQLNRRWVGVEKSEKYCEVIKHRILNESNFKTFFKGDL